MCKHLLKIQRLILALLIFGGGIFYTSSATARVCFLPDSTDCGEGDVDVPEVQITCATYGGYETEAACLEARTNKTAQTCTLNSGCYYPKCAYDSERKCKNENPNKNCLSQDVDGVKCWYSQLKTCFDQGYKSACSSDENSTPVNIEAFDGPCYKCTEKATCKQMKPGVYYGPNDTCPKYTDRKDAGVSARDGKCSTCEPQACSAINTAYKSEAKKDTCGSDKEAKKVEGTDSAADGPCYTCQKKENTCPTGFKADVTCGEGFTKFENPNHKGCYQCQCRNQGTINGKCTNCSAEGYTEEASNDWYCTEACPLNSQAFKPESCTWLGSSCPTGYSTEYQSQNDCGYDQVFMRNGSSKGKTCGVCTYSNGCSSGWATNVPCDTARGFTLIKNIPSQPGCYQCSCQNQGIINGKCTSCDAEGYTYVKNTEGYICSGMCPLSNRYFKSCKKIDNKCSGYTQIKELNSNCYSCSACPDDSKLYKCVENIKAGYTLTDGECKLEMCSGNKVKVICSLSNNGVLSCSSYIPYGAAYGRITRVTIRSRYEYNLYEGGEGCREGSHSLKNPRIESLYCDVYGAWGGSYSREPDRIIEMDKISDNQWSCTTYQ